MELFTNKSSYLFTSKETYLAYRAQWKAIYKALSADIRSKKRQYKNAQRDGDGLGWKILSELRRAQQQAREMLEQLAEAKIEAQRQWLAQRNS